MKAWSRFYFAVCAIVIIDWIVYALAKQRVTAVISNRFGEQILKLGQGKIREVAPFVQHRFSEMLWLSTLVLLFVAAQWLFNRFARAQIGRNRWAAQAVVGFVLLNLWVGAAMNTAIFWAALRAGAGVQNLAQFHFKRILAEENPAPKAVLVGSSQTRAQIDEDLLNQLIGSKLWTTELHFPGSHGYDVLLIERQLRRANPQLVICYVSEGYFYLGSQGETPPNFLTLSDVPDGLHRGAERYLSEDEIISGLLGNMMPLFRCREAIAQRVFGETAVQLKQEQYNTALSLDFDARAREFADKYHIDEESNFQKNAFEEFVARCQRANRRVILLSGGYNPILERLIDPSIHADMIAFLKQLQDHYPEVAVVSATDLVEQSASDYDDLSHVNPAAQERFTKALGRLLPDFLTEEKSVP